MQKRIWTGVVLAGALFVLISVWDAWPLRYGLAGCFLVALIEMWAAGSFGTEKARSPRGKRSVYTECGVLILAGAALLLSPIRPAEMLAIAIAAYVADIGGYFAGTKFGKNKVQFLEKLSPNKTREGYIGGLIASWVVTGLFLLIFGKAIPVFPKVGLWLLGGIVGCAGDLLGSATKRELDIKDADEYTRHMKGLKHVERLMAGHGGFLDRFDSFSLVVVFYYILLLINGALA